MALLRCGWCKSTDMMIEKSPLLSSRYWFIAGDTPKQVFKCLSCQHVNDGDELTDIPPHKVYKG